MTKLIISFALLIATGLGAACGPADDQSANRLPLSENNSQVFNGFSLNGFSLNGFSLNGTVLNGTVLNGIALNGTALSGVALAGGSLTAFQGATVIGGTGLTGTLLDVVVTPTGSTTTVHYTLKLDNVTLAPGTTDVYLYNVTYQPSGSSTWQSACVDSAGSPVAAVLLANHWDPQTGARIDDSTTFTFACVNAALGKCVLWGYRPWASATRCVGTQCTTVRLTDYHQACTRLVRADYCGNGVPHTVNGTLIDIFDDLSPPIQARAGSWGLEARWEPDGASCMSGARVPALVEDGKTIDCSADGNGPCHGSGHGDDDGQGDDQGDGNGHGNGHSYLADCNRVATPWLITSTCQNCKVKK